jgi:hypothetical protein
MRTIFLFVFAAFLFSSCLSYSRMTSPVIMEPTERSWTIGVQQEGAYANNAFRDHAVSSDEGQWDWQSGNYLDNYSSAGIIPVISYRDGLEELGGEIGVTLFPQFFPALAIDYKHRIYRSGNFHLSGDITGTLGFLYGAQYDLLFGNRHLYGQVGYKIIQFSLMEDLYVLGIGTEINDTSPLGIQLTYARMIGSEDDYSVTPHMLSLGMKLEFRRTKKRFRMPKKKSIL